MFGMATIGMIGLDLRPKFWHSFINDAENFRNMHCNLMTKWSQRYSKLTIISLYQYIVSEVSWTSLWPLSKWSFCDSPGGHSVIWHTGNLSKTRNFTPKVSSSFFLKTQNYYKRLQIPYKKTPDFAIIFLSSASLMTSSSVLTQNDQVLKIFSLYPKVSNSAKNFYPKITDGRPVCIMPE